MGIKMRSFIAAGVPESVSDYDISEIGRFAKISVVKPEKRHITLHFLGEISDEESKIAEFCIKALHTEPFSVKMTHIDTFRNDVVFMGGESQQLMDIQHKLGVLLKSEGFKIDKRPFRIHMTLCRVRSIKDKQMFANFIKTCQSSFQETHFNVESIVLYKSELTPHGAEYTPLYQHLL